MKRAPDGSSTSRTEQGDVVRLVPGTTRGHVAASRVHEPGKLGGDDDEAAGHHSLNTARLDVYLARTVSRRGNASIHSQERLNVHHVLPEGVDPQETGVGDIHPRGLNRTVYPRVSRPRLADTRIHRCQLRDVQRARRRRARGDGEFFHAQVQVESRVGTERKERVTDVSRRGRVNLRG